MKKREITGALFWLLAGLVFSILSAGYPVGGLTQPGPGFLPMILGVLLTAFSIVLLARALRMPSGIAQGFRLLPHRKRCVLSTIGVLFGAVALFETAGYLLTFFALALCLAAVTGWVRWRTSVLFAALSVLGIYVIFVWLLKQPMPLGLLGV